MDLVAALGASQLVGQCGFSDAIPAQMPIVSGAIIDVMRMMLAAKSAFERHNDIPFFPDNQDKFPGPGLAPALSAQHAMFVSVLITAKQRSLQLAESLPNLTQRFFTVVQALRDTSIKGIEIRFSDSRFLALSNHGIAKLAQS
jgi:hypothetical protein